MKTWTIMAAGLMGLAGAMEAHAADQAKVDAIKNGQAECLWCDLSGADLSNTKLNGVNLSGSDLTGAKLNMVNFSNVDLTGAYLTEADLTGAVFDDTTFAKTHLEGVDLTVISARGANFETAYCNWQTKLPAGWVCEGVVVKRK